MRQQDLGRGEPLVLIHGLGADHGIWRPVAESLAADHRVVTVDVPGFGAAPPVAEDFEFGEVAIALWRDVPDDRPVTLVGHSMGGALALTMAAAAPQRTARLVLCASAGLRVRVPPAAAPVLARLASLAVQVRPSAELLAGTAPGRRALLGAGVAPANDLGEAEVRRIVEASARSTRWREALATAMSTDMRPLLALAPPQLATLWGAQDKVVPLDDAQIVRTLRPDALHASVPGAGHMLMLERPRAFAAVLRQLLRELGEVHQSATSGPAIRATVQANVPHGV